MSDNKDTKLDKLEKEDVELWREMTRDVDLMPGQTYQAGDSETRAGKSARPISEVVVMPKAEPKARKSSGGTGLDRRSDERLRRGQMAIEAQLDLHGLNQVAAYEALQSFIHRSYASGLRCVLVITGKGRTGPGVLRQRLPEWLAEDGVSGLILKTHSAQPKHGGGGAFYVLLRRHR